MRSPRALRAGAGVFLCHRHRLRGPLRRGWPLPLPGWAGGFNDLTLCPADTRSVSRASNYDAGHERNNYANITGKRLPNQHSTGLGASCGATAVCGMGYYCDSGTGECAALPVVGQPCMLTRAGTTTRLQCVASWCDADGTKICQPRKADGEPCTSQCIFQPCIFDDQCVGYCDTSTQTCAGDGQGLVCVSPP